MRKAATKATTKTVRKSAKNTPESGDAKTNVQTSYPILGDFGLRPNLDYHFLPSGLIDWKKMIPDEFIVLNREKFLKRDEPIDLDSLSKDEVQELKKKAKEDELIIKLGGYRELAAIRGFSKVEQQVISASPEFVCVACTISWLPNFETDMFPVSFTSVADAHLGNCAKEFSANYLSAIASNRAFCRAVREFLRISIVAQDEIAFEKPEEIVTAAGVTPIAVLKDKMARMDISFEELKEILLSNEEYDWTGVDAWKNLKDIQPKYFPLIFGLLSK